MTVREIRKQVPSMAIKLAEATIRQARKALAQNTGWNDVKRADYNLLEVEMASAVLFEMFEAHEFAIRQALIRMPEALDGLHGQNYFDAFVEALERYLGKFAEHETVRLREPDGSRQNRPKKKSHEMER